MVIQIVRFRSKLPEERVLSAYEERAPRYRAQPGLIEKYYMKFSTGENGAVYVWDSEEALRNFRASELAATIPTVYAVEGEPEVATGDVVMVLHSSPLAPTGSRSRD